MYFGFQSMKQLKEHNNRNFGLDLCRCLAVSMVLFIHSGQIIFQTSFPFLWYLPIGGVELFFSLSGFLIGRVLLHLFETENVTIRDIGRFWAQRWLRTLPLYYILYFVYLFRDNLLMQQVPFNGRYLLFLHNFTTPPPAFFGESSTLSIEEWFYLGFPLLTFIVLLLARKFRISFLTGKRAYIAVAAILIISGILLRWQYINTGRFIAVSVVFRMDAIAYGLLAAILSEKIAAMTNIRAAALIISGTVLWGIAAIIRLKFFYGIIEQSYYLFSGTGTALVVLGLYYFSFRTKPRIVPYISKISYSIYLVHLTGVVIPLAFLYPVQDRLDQWLMLLLALTLTISLSSMTYKFIERPFLRLRGRWFPKERKTAVSE